MQALQARLAEAAGPAMAYLVSNTVMISDSMDACVKRAMQLAIFSDELEAALGVAVVWHGQRVYVYITSLYTAASCSS
jgi:hypothetical protein